MLISPHAAASRVPRGRGTAGGPGDDPRGRFPAAERLQDQRFARRSGGGRLSPKYPAAASEAGKASSPTSSPRRPRPQLARLIGHAPRARDLVGVVVLGGRLGAAAGRRSPQTRGLGNYNCESRPASPRPRTPRRPMRRDHAGLQNTRRCGRGKRGDLFSGKPGWGAPCVGPCCGSRQAPGFTQYAGELGTNGAGSLTFGLKRILCLIHFPVASHLLWVPM